MKKDDFTMLIIEDDFHVANIIHQFIEQMEGFSVLTVAKTGEVALKFLKNTNRLPDLILLDLYIPDVQGLDLFWKIRKEYHTVDLIIVTAAKEVATIEEVLRGGVFDYIVKPYDYNRIHTTLQRYRQHRHALTAKNHMEQEEIDRLTGVTGNSPTLQTRDALTNSLPKGIDPITLAKIKEILQQHVQGLTSVEVGEKIGISRSTARRYLEYLASIKESKTVLRYGEVGRPERVYLPS